MAGGKALRFPEGFVWGTATAAYQIEGGWCEGGRGWSIWDAFSREGGVINNENGDRACDHYHKYPEDVKLMADIGLKYYRLSISWPRIQPLGTGKPNPEGVAFYNKLIDCLLEHGIEPVVTLYHWDLPLALQTEHEGWLSMATAGAFAEYARICFTAFGAGSRVKTWITFNEPWCTCLLGMGNGEHAPGVKSPDGSKVYRSAHTVLVAHARAVDIYRKEFQPEQGGKIGITLNANWSEPKPSEDPDAAAGNAAAAERALVWNLAWFADPVYTGDYPRIMRDKCGDRLPHFTEEEKALLKGSSDYFGLNHYSTDYAEDSDVGESVSHWGNRVLGGFWEDMRARSSVDLTWPITDMGWAVVPWGFTKLLLWIQARYSPAGGIIVTENGCAVKESSVEAAINDYARVAYFASYVAAMHDAITAGADVRGYFAWSFCDNFEWAFGYTKRFGLHYVDYITMERTPKLSAKWFSDVVARNAVTVDDGLCIIVPAPSDTADAAAADDDDGRSAHLRGAAVVAAGPERDQLLEEERVTLQQQAEPVAAAV